MLKACLVAKSLEPPKTHDLVRLLRECQKAGTDLTDLLEDCSTLLQYASLTRYPGSFTYSERMGRESSNAAERVYTRVRGVVTASEGA
jgi:HEPN domain-containing protein